MNRPRTVGVKRIRSVSRIAIRIQFDKRVRDDPFFLDPDNYVLMGGSVPLVPLAVMIRGDDMVDLQTTPQDVDQPYELTLKDDFKSPENKTAG